MSTLQRISIKALTAVVLGTVGASAGDLPRYEVTGFPISPLQMSVLKSGDIQEQSPTPMLTLNGMPASPHQIAVILGLCSVVWRSAPCFEGQITELARPHLENLGSTVLGVVPPCGFPAEQKSATTKRAPATLGCHPPMDKKPVSGLTFKPGLFVRHMALVRKCPRHHVRVPGTHTTTEALS
jgi:hypothetical protein